MNDLQARDRAVVWHPFTQAATAPEPLPVVAADGAFLTLADGRRILDGISSWWTCLHGHGQPRIAAAIADQARRLDHVLLAGCTHPGAVQLAERLVDLAPDGLGRVFYSDDGSTAVEVALKMALQHFAQTGQPQRTRYLALHHGYHGDTVGAMAVGDPGDYGGPFAPLRFPVHRVTAPATAGWPLAQGHDVTQELAALGACLTERGAEVAALIVEPLVQAAGGMRLQPPAWLRGVADLCKQHGILLIADEVMTGFGRTGALFACQHAGVTPDLLCLAKGLTGGTLPLAATLATNEIYESFLDTSRRRAFLHGHSFTANPIACAAALASLDLLAEDPQLSQVAEMQRIYATALPAIGALPQVREVRWLGGLGVVELHGGEGYFSEGLAQRTAARMLARGVLMRPLGPVLYLLPPFCLAPRTLAETLEALGEAITEG